jgi:CheY-like chemotaxis protein
MRELQRVMCVEDDADIRIILEFSLGQIGGYTVQLCASGAEALAAAPVFLPQMVLLDVMMPAMSGPQTLKQLRDLGCMQGVPVLFVTARALPDEIEALVEYGATGIIVKPFDAVTLPQDIHRYWEQGLGTGI